MSFADMHDGGHNVKSAFGAISTLTAAGTGDNTEVDGAWIDRQGYQSCKVVLAHTADLTATKTLAVIANLQDASEDDGTGSGDYGDALTTTVVSTGEGGGSTETGVVELYFDLASAKRYIRIQYTPNLSASGTDTAKVSAVIELYGSDVLPVS